MALILYNDINRFISTVIRTSRFWDSNTDFRFEYRWGYQPIVPKLNQDVPLFFASIREMNSRNVTPIEQCEYSAEDNEYTNTIYQNFEIEVDLVFRQQQAPEEWLEPPTLPDGTWDGSLILSQVVAGMWNNETALAMRTSNVGFLRPGIMSNDSGIVSGRYVREFSIPLYFDTLVSHSYNAGVLEKVYFEGTEVDTGSEFDFSVTTPEQS